MSGSAGTKQKKQEGGEVIIMDFASLAKLVMLDDNAGKRG